MACRRRGARKLEETFNHSQLPEILVDFLPEKVKSMFNAKMTLDEVKTLPDDASTVPKAGVYICIVEKQEQVDGTYVGSATRLIGGLRTRIGEHNFFCDRQAHKDKFFYQQV